MFNLFSDIKEIKKLNKVGLSLSSQLPYYNFIPDPDYTMFVTKSGGIFLWFGLAGIDLSLASKEILKNISVSLSKMFEALPVDTTIELYTMKKRENFFLNYSKDNKFKEIFDYKKKYWENKASNTFYLKNAICVGIDHMFEKNLKGVNHFNKLAFQNLEKNYTKKIKKIKNIGNILMERLKDFSLYNPGEEHFLEFVQELVNGKINDDKIKNRKKNENIDTLVSDISRIEFKKNNIELKDNFKTKYMSKIEIIEQATNSYPLFFEQLFEVDSTFCVQQIFRIANKKKIEKKLNKNRQNYKILYFNKKSLDYGNIEDDIRNDYTKRVDYFLNETEKYTPVFWSCNITVTTDTKEELKKITTQIIESQLRNIDVKAIPVYNKHLKLAYFSSLPSNGTYIYNKMLTLSANAGDYFYPSIAVKGANKPTDFFVSKNEGLYGFNLIEKEVFHTFISGSSGSGKSFLTNRLLINSILPEELPLYIVDLSESYYPLFNILKNQFPKETNIVSISKEKIDFSFNPFDLTIGKKKEDDITQDKIIFFEKLINLLVGEIEVDDVVILREVLSETFYRYKDFIESEKKYPPPLTFLLKALRPSGISKKLINSLRKWLVEGTIIKNIFDNGKNDISNAKYILFDIKALKELKEEMLPITFSIMRFIEKGFEQHIAQKKILVLDEAHLYLNNPIFEEMTVNYLRTGRHNSLGIIIVSQGLLDLLAWEEVKKAKDNIKNYIIFNGQKGNEISHFFSADLGLSPHVFDYYSMTNKREFLLIQDDFPKILKGDVDPIIYWIATTNEAEEKIRDEVVKICNNNYKEAIIICAKLTENIFTPEERINKIKEYLKNDKYNKKKL